MPPPRVCNLEIVQCNYPRPLRPASPVCALPIVPSLSPSTYTSTRALRSGIERSRPSIASSIRGPKTDFLGVIFGIYGKFWLDIGDFFFEKSFSMYFFEDLKNVKEIKIVKIFKILKTPNISCFKFRKFRNVNNFRYLFFEIFGFNKYFPQ